MLSHAANNENDEATSKKTFLFCGASEGRPQCHLLDESGIILSQRKYLTRSLISSKYTLRLTLVLGIDRVIAALKFDECAVACTTSSVLPHDAIAKMPKYRARALQTVIPCFCMFVLAITLTKHTNREQQLLPEEE